MRMITRWSALALTITLAVAVARQPAPVQVVASAVSAVVLLGLLVRWVRRPRIRSWQDAERATARWLRKVGCRRVSLTGGSADGGIDVITSQWAVQVKHTSKRVGRPAVQQLVGAALTLDREPALFSTSGFSGPAVIYANDHQVALFELDSAGRAAGINSASRSLGKRRKRLLAARPS